MSEDSLTVTQLRTFETKETENHAWLQKKEGRWKVFCFASLLCISGGCALIYQSVWLREFRLIFGASTMASAAVLAIFMGGLGAGSIVLGAKVDRSRRPIRWYGRLEIGIAIAAAVSPFLLEIARNIFVTIGGSFAMGSALGTMVRLLLSTLVLFVPSFLMGGTLPALARAAETTTDVSRKHLAYLYGANTLGAVVGVAVSNFYLFELFGNRLTLWSACLLNALVVVFARQLSRSFESSGDPAAKDPGIPTKIASNSIKKQPHRAFVVVIACCVGFAFMFMELVWYRMLGPILGGTTFTFGIILAVALAGIGLGGLLYPLMTWRLKPSLGLLAMTCSTEALFVGIPLALGDWIAELAWLLRATQTFGFSGQVASWIVICMLVVFPVAFLAGLQFPLLIALLGEGKEGVGKDTGIVYVSNTIGSILGSLAGGFGLLPLLSAVGAWRSVVVLLAVLAIMSALRGSGGFSAPPIILSVIAGLLLLFSSPTAVWRHSGIGAGRAGLIPQTTNERRAWQTEMQRSILWQKDGVESGVALSRGDGIAFVVNGKADGNIYSDAGTQVVSGILGAMLSDGAKSSCVIGLGTGSTAGWLAFLPETERVDVIELEPDIRRVAEDCALANQHVLSNPKTNLIFGDGREWLLTTSHKYDLIFSEPSNPYRAGIASLFTREFYEAAEGRLTANGIFAQWVQAYEIDSQAICSIYATLLSVFPCVETWQTARGDLILIAAQAPRKIDAERLREKIRLPAYRSALVSAWRVESLEGILARYVGGNRLAQAVAKGSAGQVNTDDLNSLEYSFGRSVGKQHEVRAEQLRLLAGKLNDSRPNITRGEIDWNSVEKQVAMRFFGPGSMASQMEQNAASMQVIGYVHTGQYAKAAGVWHAKEWLPSDLAECSHIALALAMSGHSDADRMAAKVEEFSPTEAWAIRAILRSRQKKPSEAIEALLQSFSLFRTDPWASTPVMREALNLAIEIAKSDRAAAVRFDEALKESFAVERVWVDQQMARLRIAAASEESEANKRSLAVLQQYEPYPIWDRTFLAFRASCYRKLAPERAASAARDLREFDRYRDISIPELIPGEASGAEGSLLKGQESN